MMHSAAHKLGGTSLDVNKLPNAKNQHYVWRYYLSAWTTDGNFWCHRYKAKSLFRTQPKSVANEHYFYEAHRLTTADEEFLESIIKLGADEELREINRNFIRYSQATFNRPWKAGISLFDGDRSRIASSLDFELTQGLAKITVRISISRINM